MEPLTRERQNRLDQAARQFFKHYGTSKLLGRETALLFSGYLPEKRFEVFRDLCGFPRDSQGFFRAIHAAISRASVLGGRKQILLNGVDIPLLFLYQILEILYPSNRILPVKTLAQLKELTNTQIPDQDKEALQLVLDLYPVKLSDHVIRQSRVSNAVASQYFPFAQELDPRGHALTFDGHFKAGVLEQMYQNRVIFLLDMGCPVYCRFCFRKHKELRQEKSPGVADVKIALERVRGMSLVREVLITGGEPLMNRKNMETALEGLIQIDHITTLRIATRSIAYYPQLFLANNREYLEYLKSQQAVCVKKGKRLEMGIHFVHPDEVSLQSLDIIGDLVKSGITVYVQTPFLNLLNNGGAVLAKLFTLLRNAGAQIYYIFTPCHPIHGTQKYWTPISQAIEAYQYLRAHLSDRCMPKLCTATPLGKMEWHSSGWAVAQDASDPDHVWIRTPYTREYFKAVTGEEPLFPDLQENPDSTLNVRCLMALGDRSLLRGNRFLFPETGPPPVHTPLGSDEIQKIQEALLAGDFFMPSIVNTPCRSVIRVHKTRVELDLSAGRAALAYVRENPEITDAVLHVSHGQSLMGQVDRVCGLVKELGSIDHIASVRLRWKAFQDRPENFTPKILEQIRGLARFSLSDPLRIEMETWWTLPREITPGHGRLVRELAGQGIQTYANLALISGMNTDPEVMVEMALGLRRAGMVFHHVYVAGLAIQARFNGNSPVHSDQVLAIASRLRRVCSGREIPLYMIQTPLGEVDFGLTSCLVWQESAQTWFLRLAPFGLDHFTAMDPGFTLKPPILENQNRTLMVPVTGLVGPSPLTDEPFAG